MHNNGLQCRRRGGVPITRGESGLRATAADSSRLLWLLIFLPIKKRPIWEWNRLLWESFWWKPLQGIYRCSKIKPDKNSSYQQKFIFISTKNICTEQPAECDLVSFSKSHLTTIARQDDARHRWPDHHRHLIALLPHPSPLRVRTPPTK